MCVCVCVCIGIARRVDPNTLSSRNQCHALPCAAAPLPCAHTVWNNVGPEGMKHLSEALMSNKSLTSLTIGGT